MERRLEDRLFQQCSLYESEGEQLSVAADYLADGIRSGDRVVYVAESEEARVRFKLGELREA